MEHASFVGATIRTNSCGGAAVRIASGRSKKSSIKRGSEMSSFWPVIMDADFERQIRGAKTVDELLDVLEGRGIRLSSWKDFFNDAAKRRGVEPVEPLRRFVLGWLGNADLGSDDSYGKVREPKTKGGPSGRVSHVAVPEPDDSESVNAIGGRRDSN